MNKFVHFLGYSVAFVVVGILIMTATGQLAPALRGDIMGSSSMSISPTGIESSMPSSAESSIPEGIVSEDGKTTFVEKGDGTVEAYITPTESSTQTSTAYAGGTTGGDDSGTTGGAMLAAGAVTCQPGIQTKGPQDPAGKQRKINCPGAIPGDSYFAAPAIAELQTALGCTNAAAAAATVACPDAVNCEKDGTPTMQTPNPFTTCTVKNKKKDTKTKTCTADVDCGPAQCDYKQLCKPKPRKTCCTGAGGAKTCRDGAGTCNAGETVGTDYAADQCAANCSSSSSATSANVVCCGNPNAWACATSCATGVASYTHPDAATCNANCSTPSSNSSSAQTARTCCKTTTNAYACRPSCAAAETIVFVGGDENACNSACNASISSSIASSEAATCCANGTSYVCRVSCLAGETGFNWGNASACNLGCFFSSVSSAFSS